MLSSICLNTTLILVTTLGLVLYLYIKRTYSYWQRRGVKFLKPKFPFGNYEDTFRQKLCIGEQVRKIYNSTDEPFIGVFGAIRPILVVRDPELVRSVLIKDFQHFSDRGVHYDEQKDPLSAHMFALEPNRWKHLRTKLTPTFTSGKLKAMLPTIVDCTIPLRKHIGAAADQCGIIEAREVASCYTTDVITSVAFGLDVDSFSDPDTGFRKYGRQFFASNLKNALRFVGMFVFPKILKWFRVRLIDHDIEDFMVGAVRDNLELREKHKIVRKDFFQLLVQLRNTGNVEQDDVWDTKIIADENQKQISIVQMAAQSFIFFIAGFETSSSTMCFALFELAKQPDLQKRVQNEIDEVLARHNGEMTYEALNEMKYLECCMMETLRKYPVLPVLNREVTKNYIIPGTNIKLEKGTAVKVPLLALHHDEKYYSNPNHFDPERFNDENKGNIVPGTYAPFGDGPRNCVGFRLGKLQSKIGMASILSEFTFELGDEHVGKELRYSPVNIGLAPKDDVNLKAKRRQTA